MTVQINLGSADKKISRPVPLSELWIDLRMTFAMRVILALSALGVMYIDPSEPERFVAPSHIALAGYAVYSILLYVFSRRDRHVLPLRVLPWLDVAWYTLLIGLSSGTSSFFFFFFFAILVASFGWGLTSGLSVTIVSAFLFTAVGYATAQAGPEFQLIRFLLRTIQLLILGYMIAIWGGLQNRLRARLRLLKEVSRVSNPRFGVERTVQIVLESLRDCYHAETCLLMLPKRQGTRAIRLYGSSGEATYTLYRSDRSGEASKNSSYELSGEQAHSFLPTSPSDIVIYRKGNPEETLLYDTKTGGLTKSDSDSRAFVNALAGNSCFSVPVYYRNHPVGRLSIVGSSHQFDQADIDFVLQVIEQATGVLENIRLVDSLASDAAGQERRKIAQDIHDSVIQPYIGLQFGLAAVKHKAEKGENVLENVEELLALTNGEINDLRSYIGGLRHGETRREIFLPAVRRFASKFSEATGLIVEVQGSDDLPIYDRLAAELFQMVEEGLSNVRRHSNSTYAKLDFAIKDGQLEMTFRNARLKRLGEASFVPLSIADRSAALGGRTLVYADENRDTVVCVQIPL